MASVSPTKNAGVWYARALLGTGADGKQVRKSRTVTATTRRRAQSKADQWEVELRRTQTTHGATRRAPTVADAVAAWLKASERRGLSPTTLTSYRGHGAAITAALGVRRVDELSIEDIAAHYDTVRATGTRTHHRHRALVGVLNRAERLGWVHRNIANLVDRAPEPKRRMTPPTVEDFLLILKAAGSPVVARMLVVAVGTGMRRGELVAMRLSRFDRAAGTFTVDSAVAVTNEGTSKKAVVEMRGRRGRPDLARPVARKVRTRTGPTFIVKDSKTHQDRPLHLSDRVLQAVEAQYDYLVDRATKAGATMVADPFLWSFEPDGSVPVFPDYVTRHFARARTVAGVPHCRLHDLRHAWATWALDRGVPLPTVSEQLGHASPHTTFKIYAHGVSETAKQAQDMIGGLITGELEPG